MFDLRGAVVRVLMTHVMESGQRRDPAGAAIPAWHIAEVTATLNGERVLTAQWGPGVSANPFLQFRLKQAKVGDTVGINLWGHPNPFEITMEEMLVVCKAVRRGVKRALGATDLQLGREVLGEAQGAIFGAPTQRAPDPHFLLLGNPTIFTNHISGITPLGPADMTPVALLLVEQTGVRAHFGQLSCAGSVTLMRLAKDKGFPVTADVAMHQLHLTDAAIDGFNAMAHVRPPLRSEADRVALIAGVREGVIDAICSDHQPLNAAAKLAPFAEALPGMSTLETVLPLGLKLVADGELSARRLIEALTSAPARILQKPIGALGEAASGVLLIDPAQRWQVTGEGWLSVGRNTVFAGQMMTGRVRVGH